jgi:hypothetical protein
MRLPLTRLVVGLAALALAACGAASASTPPKAVPVQLTPASLNLPTGAQVAFALYRPATARFANAGAASLVADGRLWQIRSGTTLVGTLEIATFKPKVDLYKHSERQQIISLVMPGSFITTTVDGIQVVSSPTPEVNLYLWFGKQLFAVMQARTNGVDPKALLAAVIAYQKPSGQLLGASVTSKTRG